jgi:hypothetical protein
VQLRLVLAREVGASVLFGIYVTGADINLAIIELPLFAHYGDGRHLCDRSSRQRRVRVG